MNQPKSALISGVKYLLFLFALTPLLVSDSLYFFPFVFPKLLFYRTVVEAALVLFLLQLVLDFYKSRTLPTFRYLRNPVFLFVALFFLSAAVSTVFAPNAFRAFFGNVERGEGLYGVLHYFVFLILSLFVFRKNDWFTFFKLLLGVSLISSFYAWLQYATIDEFPFAFPPSGKPFEGQPGSFHGNPAFLASYLILSLGAAALVFWNSAKKSFWRYASGLIGLFSIATIFITAIRGAVLGLAVGLAFALALVIFNENRKARKLLFLNTGVIMLLALIAFGLVFWSTKEAPFWLKVPGLNRITALSFDNPSVVTRLIGAEISWNAFLEKPVFGWGMENYNVAYNKHFDPSYSFYAEDWFDRAHNRLADIAVMQGVFGLIAYLGLFVAMFVFIFKKRKTDELFARAAPALGAVVVAHFVNNLFLFDQITSYVPFFAILGFLIASSGDDETYSARKFDFNPHFLVLPLVLVAFGVLYALYFWNYLPARQAIVFRDAVRTKVGEKILAASDEFLVPYNFAQGEVRLKLVEIIYNSGLLGNEKFRPLVEKALESLEETARREPYEPRRLSALIESYNEMAKNDPSLYDKSEVFAREAVALSPKRQGLLYHLAFILAGQERFDEAIELSREALALEPRAAKSHYDLAIALALAADSEKYKGTARQLELRRESIAELETALDLGGRKLGSLEPYAGDDITATQFYLFLESDLKNMVVLYRAFDRPDRMIEILEILIAFHPENIDYRYDAIIVSRTLRNKEKIIAHAEVLKKLDPSLESDMNLIIDLAEQEDWETLDTL